MNKIRNTCDLQTCFLCKFCLKEWRPAISVNKKEIKIKKGRPVFTEGEAVHGIYFVYRGRVKVHKKWDEEKELIIRFVQTGDVLGHMGLGGSGYYPVSATAMDDVELCFIPMEFLETTMQVNNNFLRQLMLFYAGELQESEGRMRNLAHMSVKGRVAQALLALQTQFGINPQGFISFELSRQDLASYTGTSYESLFRAINELLTEDLIEISGKAIAVKNEPAFHALAQQY